MPVTVPQSVDTIESFYYWVRSRVLTINSARVFGGIVQARDWPLKVATLEAPYLLIQSDTSVPFAKSVSQQQSNSLLRVQWAWMIQGDNIQANAQSTNRGNKYRINMQMIDEMRNGHFPGQCEKLQYTLTDDGTGNPLQVVTEYNPPEYVRWTQPRFSDKIDRTSGILFCSGAVSVVAFAPAILQ